MKEKNEFDQYEMNGRKKFAQYANCQYEIWDYEFTEETYDRVDCVLMSGTSAYSPNVLVEIKDRKYPSTAKFLRKEGAVFEYEKYQGILDRMKKYGCTDAFYISYFNDNVGYMFDIKDINKMNELECVKWYYKEYPVTTANSNGEKIKKLVCDLPLNWGKKIYYN